MNIKMNLFLQARKILCVATLLFGFGIAFGQRNAPMSIENRKNVVMILVDDLKPTLGCYGDSVAISPNVDRLAQRGVRFNNAYCNQAVCVASRYNIMLGSRSTSTGLFNFGVGFRDAYPDAVTLPQYFMNAGYRSHGKSLSCWSWKYK